MTPSDLVGGNLDAVLASLGVETRTPFTDTDAVSGCRFEHAVTADRRRYIVKHMPYDEDWIMQATGDGGCRAAALWSSPWHDRLPAAIDDAVVAVAATGPSAWALVMRDVSGALFPKGSVLAADQRDALFADIAGLYAEFAGAEPPEFLLPLPDRLAFLSPAVLTRIGGPHLPIVVAGWEAFVATAPADLAAAMIALRDDGAALAAALAACPSTLLHGDLKLPNLGRTATASVLIDWQLVTWGPPALDLCWFVAMNATRCAGSADEIVDSFRARLADTTGDRFAGGDWQRALDLSVLATLAHFGWEKAYLATHADEPATRRREQASYRWWLNRAAGALERG